MAAYSDKRSSNWSAKGSANGIARVLGSAEGSVLRCYENHGSARQ